MRTVTARSQRPSPGCDRPICALNAGIREYKAAFAHVLKTMPTLLQTTSATPNLPGPAQPGHHGKHSGTPKPSPSHS